MKTEGRLTGKVALITGGASGIGQATVWLLANEGATVAYCGSQSVVGIDAALALQEAQSGASPR